MVTYVAKVSVPGAFADHTRVGAQLEAYCSGMGKVLLAALPEQEVYSFVLDGRLIALTPYTITTKAGQRTELKKVCARAMPWTTVSTRPTCAASPYRCWTVKAAPWRPSRPPMTPNGCRRYGRS